MRPRLFSFLALFALGSIAACGGGSADGGSGGAGSLSGGSTAASGAFSSGGGLLAGGSPSSGGANGGGASSGGENSSAGGAAGSNTGGASGGPGSGGTVGAGGAAAGGGGNAETGGSGMGGGEPCVVDHGEEVPSLKDYYKDHFAIGAAIDTSYQSYSTLLTKHFSSVTAEDQMKFDALEPTEGNFSYGTADGMVNFATQNGIQVRGHALVWHRQTPSWVFSGSGTQVLARMKNHITKVMQHFQGKVKIWDVVNEAIMDDGSYRTNNEADGQQSGWYGALGESYIAEAFRAARAADPEAKLFYNDYYNYHPVRRQAIYEMLSGLIDAGVPIDGVGLQSHLNLKPGTDPNEQSSYQTVENMEQAIEMYSSLGLEVQVTEVDVSLYLRGITYTSDMFYTPAKVTQAILDEQAARYQAFFDMYRAHSDVISSVTFWGISDDNTWLSEFDSGRQDFPLLFDAQKQPKPAFWAVVNFCE